MSVATRYTPPGSLGVPLGPEHHHAPLAGKTSFRVAAAGRLHNRIQRPQGAVNQREVDIHPSFYYLRGYQPARLVAFQTPLRFRQNLGPVLGAHGRGKMQHAF